MGGALMNLYGYLINENYEPKQGELTWEFQRIEADQSIKTYIGFESENQASTTDKYVVIGNSNEFYTWLNQHGIIEII